MSTISPSRYVPYGFARAHQLLVAGMVGDTIEVWIGDRTPRHALAELARLVPMRLVAVRKTDEELGAAISRAYSQNQGGSAAAVVDELESDMDLSRLMQDLPKIEDLLETEDDAPIIRMINVLLTQAARDGASDIHIEPFETHSLVRFRVDGTLRDVVRPKRELHAALISRIKIMAQLDIARLGMAPDTLATFDRLTRQPHGILLVTGPTGSGKTTTLYAALGRLDATTTNILTVEDPIEYDLSGIGQTQVNPRIDMTFAKALRSILRQDPDVVMIGEIRDLETAQIAVQASLTGHLVLATLHTNDSVSAVTRLIDMGIEPFLLSSSLIGVVAQRLVRKLCPECREPDPVAGGWRAVGCVACNRTGYQGRTGIHELFVVDDRIRALIHQGASEATLREAAEADGMRSMREDGGRWVESGVTSADEVIRVTRD